MNTQPTSKAGHEHIKPHKPTHREKILEALMKLNEIKKLISREKAKLNA